MIKHFKSLSILFFPFFFLNFPLKSFQVNDLFSLIGSVEDENQADLFSPDDLDYKNEEYTPERTLRAFTRSCEDDCDGILEAQNIFERDLYQFTHPINQRSIQDNPQFYYGPFSYLPCWAQEKKWLPFVHFFYNETHKGNFTRSKTGISSYLAFENIPNLEQFGFANINTMRILDLFKDLKIQERRAGIMLGASYLFKNCWYFSFRTPLEYLIRNFYLTPDEVKKIQADPLFNDTNPTTDDEKEVEIFAREHLISDRIGIGDTRLNFGYFGINRPNTSVIFGGEMTLPTAYAVKKGLYGNHFSKNAATPTIDLCQLCNLITNGDVVQVEEILTNFLIQSLDRLSRILLETSLGNNGHIGLGPVIEYRNFVTPKLEFRTHANLEYLMPAWERRFFIFKKNPEDFARLDPNQPNTLEQLHFLEKQIVETFFPSGFNTLVFPGFIFKLSTALNGSLAKNKVHVQIGYDLWWQQAEQFGKIAAPSLERERLRTDIAKRPSAYQSKIFGAVSYFRRGRKYDWYVKLYGDKTFLRSGIGKDFNLGLRFELFL